MYIGLIAKRYAKALLEYATVNQDESQTYEEVQRLITCYRQDLTIREALFSPVLSEDIKLRIVYQHFEKKISISLDKFIRLVLRHHREHYLYFMLYSFQGLYKQKHNIRDAQLITAAPVDDLVVERIAETARRRTQSNVQIRKKVQPELMGGFIFRIDDLLIDASVATQIRLLRRKLGRKPNRIV